MIGVRYLDGLALSSRIIARRRTVHHCSIGGAALAMTPAGQNESWAKYRLDR
jgi:hypothetical protein